MIARDLMLLFVLSFTAWAAWCDLRTGHIPNHVTLGALGLGGALALATACWGEAAPRSLTATYVLLALARSAFGMLTAALVPYLLFLRNGMGGGDVKLLAAVGASLGPVLGLEMELYAFVAMLAFACLRLACAGQLWRSLGNSLALLAGPLSPSARERAVAPDLSSSFKFAPAVFAAAALLCLTRWQ
jgi:prepilin peptidase CpaA